MTTWKQYPHLFWIFKVRIDYNLSEIPMSEILTEHYDINSCNLIARKIEDMTDEEINRHPHYGLVDDYKWAKEQIEILADSESINIESFLHLTDIGVYPFDQSHFETGDVIDIKTL